MQTSNFAKSAGDPRAVAITRGIPKWYQGRVYQDLAPQGWMLKIADKDEFERVFYRNVLVHRDPQKVLRDLGDDAVLLCYEGPDKWCHRHMVAEWLSAALKQPVPELQREMPPQPADRRKKENPQGCLFGG